MLQGNVRPTLADFAHLKVCTFMDRAYRRDFPMNVRDAFWRAIYSGADSVPLRTARQVAIELNGSERTVADVMDGWRPAALN